MFRWFVVVGIIGASVLLGPLASAAIGALLAPAGNHSSATFDLLKEFDERDRSIVSASMDFEGAIRDCGYRSEDLFSEKDMADFPGPRGAWPWSPYAGYFALTLLRSSNWHMRLDALRAEWLQKQTSSFSAVFLRECMRQTLFARICENHTRSLLGKWASAHSGPADAAENLTMPGENRTICTYLDGLAARQGKALATRRN